MVTDLLGVNIELYKEKACIRAVAFGEYGWVLLLELENGRLKSYDLSLDTSLRVLP